MMIVLGGAPASLHVAFTEYHTAWKAFLVVHHLEALEHLAVATTLSWKVDGKAALYANLRAIGDKAEQIHIGTVNDRFIASAVLHEPFEGMYLIKILERRAGSKDPLGLDSIDYLLKDLDGLYKQLKAAGAHVAHESNDMHKWLSLRFGKNYEYEAKFTDHLVLDVAMKEMDIAHKRLKKKYLRAA